MTTVQLAILDSEYAQSLRNLLLRDGTHRVLLVDKPDLKVDGVVVMDSVRFAGLSLAGAPAERFVVITRKGEDHLTRIWEAGVRHVVFEEDSPNTAQLAVIAAELRIPKSAEPLSKEAAVSETWAPPDREKRHSKAYSALPLLISRPQCSHCRFAQKALTVF